MKKIKRTTKGKPSSFVTPTTPTDQNNFCVNIPEDESGRVRVIEITSTKEFPDVVTIHVSLEMRKWIAIADHLQREFYARGLRPGKWVVGDNLIDRMFGRELCVLGVRKTSTFYEAARELGVML